MNSWKLGLENLHEIADAAARPDHSFVERCGLYSAARLLLNDIDAHAADYAGLEHGLEKTETVRWHISAMLGLDIDNGHDQRQHHAWALSALNALTKELGRAFPDER